MPFDVIWVSANIGLYQISLSPTVGTAAYEFLIYASANTGVYTEMQCHGRIKQHFLMSLHICPGTQPRDA